MRRFMMSLFWVIGVIVCLSIGTWLMVVYFVLTACLTLYPVQR